MKKNGVFGDIMPEKVIDSFYVRRLDILDENGDADMALMPPVSESYIKRIYELVVLSRMFDQFALNLQREGRLGTYPSILGQEASHAVMLLPKLEDYYVPNTKRIQKALNEVMKY